jgi:hypothetical protein
MMTVNNPFTKATRKRARARLAIDGPSGCGKTHSALLIAKGLVGEGGKIAVIDTENSSAELEAGKPGIPEFEHVNLEPPYEPERYIDLIKKAEQFGYDCIIVDSGSHAWFAEGGLLDRHDSVAKASRTKDRFGAWREITPAHNAFVEAMIRCKSHLILTLRTKTEWDYVEKNGRMSPTKVGTKPIQRDGVEYEFTIVFDLSVEGHIASVSKDRTSLFDGKNFVPSADTGATLREWLNAGNDPAAESAKVRTKIETAFRNTEDEAELRATWDQMLIDMGRLVDGDKAALTALVQELTTGFRAKNQDEPPAQKEQAPTPEPEPQTTAPEPDKQPEPAPPASDDNDDEYSMFD